MVADFYEKVATIRFISIPQAEKHHQYHATPKSLINWHRKSVKILTSPHRGDIV